MELKIIGTTHLMSKEEIEKIIKERMRDAWEKSKW